MKDDRVPHEHTSAQRADARRRAAQADVANYIHDLSDRHAAAAATPDTGVVATSRGCDDG